MKQQSFASLTYAAKKRKTRKERFLEQMESCVPWSAFEAIIEPYYPKAGKRGGQPTLPAMESEAKAGRPQ